MQLFWAMAEAINIERCNIHFYLTFLHLFPLLIKCLMRGFIQSKYKRDFERVKKQLQREQALKNYLRGPSKRRRRYPPPKFKEHHPTMGTLTTGVANDPRSWWPRFLRGAVHPTNKPTSSGKPSKHMPILFHALRSSTPHPHRAKRCHFDTDSFKIGIDNHASRCMSNNRAHFEHFRPFVFKLEDDDGKIHTIRIPNSLYIPRLPLSLLSPQHWAQEANDNTPLQNGTRMENFANGCKLI